jgi:hypothetical protein
MLGLSMTFRDYWQPFIESSRFGFIAELLIVGGLPLFIAVTVGLFLLRDKLGRYELTWLGGELVKHVIRKSNKEKIQNA